MQTTQLEEDKCPACGFSFDRATNAFGDTRPAPNDLTVCVNCRFILCFDADLKLRKATTEDLENLAELTRGQLAFLLFSLHPETDGP